VRPKFVYLVVDTGSTTRRIDFDHRGKRYYCAIYNWKNNRSPSRSLRAHVQVETGVK